MSDVLHFTLTYHGLCQVQMIQQRKYGIINQDKL